MTIVLAAACLIRMQNLFELWDTLDQKVFRAEAIQIYLSVTYIQFNLHHCLSNLLG